MAFWCASGSTAWVGRLIGISAIVTGLFVAGFSQPAAGPLKAVVRMQDWDLSGWAAVRMGRLGVIHQAEGDQLRVYSLLTSQPVFNSRIRSRTPACDGNCLQVSSYDEGIRNRLGGHFSAFQSLPSTARAVLDDWVDGRRALTLDFTKAGAGYCGLWIHLFDSSLPVRERIYLDASPFSVLTFWIRGRDGGERVLLKISDAAWDRKEDAVPVGNVESYLPDGRVERAWRQAVVPLSVLPRDINRGQLAALVLEGAGGAGRVAVKDVQFCIHRETLPALSAPKKSEPGSRALERGLWVWNTAEILTDEVEQVSLADFCRRQGIHEVFLQLPREKGELAPTGGVLLKPERWKRFLALLSRNGVRAAALDGSREYALREWHPHVLATVDHVVRYNRSARPEERFSGVHYDIEPYLLPGFQGGARTRLMGAYLELLKKIGSRVRNAGMTFAADIPFWYDTPDELTGQSSVIEYGGTSKTADRHIIDLVDQVVIMDYRTAAYGANGLLALSEGELAYAARTGKKALVGLETTDLPDEDLIDFDGKASRGLPARAPAIRAIVAEPDSANGGIWLVQPSQWEEFLYDLRARGTDLQSLSSWPVRRVTAVPAARLTFSRLGAKALEQAMVEAQAELLRQPAFSGFAIHDYLGYIKLMKPPAGK